MLAFSVTLVACAPSFTWVKDGSTREDFTRDKYQCQNEATQYAKNLMGDDTLGVAIMAGDRTVECLQARGWQKKPI